MRFRNYDNLRIFSVVARHSNISAAAEEMNLTKGAVSYQIRTVEEALGFELFIRNSRGVSLTGKGRELLATANPSFAAVEDKIRHLQQISRPSVSVAMSTYFASRWLSPRLMNFIKAHSEVRLRIEPMVDLINLEGDQIDLAIRWGNGNWDDLAILPLFKAPAFVTGPKGIAREVAAGGLEAVLHAYRLLDDREGSTAWADWFARAGLAGLDIAVKRENRLVIPDPNVRAQAVIDGQGLALNDRLIAVELAQGRVEKIHPIQMDEYGYFLAYRPASLQNPAIKAFVEWIGEEGARFGNETKNTD